MTQLNQDSLVTLLLCSDLGLSLEMKKAYKPYTLAQWNKLTENIRNSSLKKPSELLNAKKDMLKYELSLDDYEINRIDFLLKRGVNIAVEIEKLQSLGIYITTRAEKNYPNKLKRSLKKYSPPIIYYSGNLNLVNKRTVAIVGSRDVDKKGELFTEQFVSKCVQEGYIIVSGGAKGVDSIAESTSIRENGYAISIVPDGLEKKIKEKDIRNSILSGRLLLMSMNNPNARFSVYSAMDRNKYIYGLSKYAIAVSSSYDSGGTWNGATENLKKEWTPLYVRNENDIPLGNQKLIELGAKPISLEIIEENGVLLEKFFNNSIESESSKKKSKIEQMDIYSMKNDIIDTPRVMEE